MFRQLADSALAKSRSDPGVWRRRTRRREVEAGWGRGGSSPPSSCVLGLADVVGRHVAPAAFRLAQPPLAVAVHVVELQDPQLLVGGDAQLVGTAGVEGVEGVVNLEERGEEGRKEGRKEDHVRVS